jgi:hypothetical protein
MKVAPSVRLWGMSICENQSCGAGGMKVAPSVRLGMRCDSGNESRGASGIIDQDRCNDKSPPCTYKSSVDQGI